MQLPDGVHLAYNVMHEAWYAAVPGVVDEPSLNVCASHEGDGVSWEFVVRDSTINVRQLTMFADSWPAFVQIPEFFVELSRLPETATLQDVRKVLDALGAVDETDRRDPHASA